jgi:hypothetical protein
MGKVAGFGTSERVGRQERTPKADGPLAGVLKIAGNQVPQCKTMRVIRQEGTRRLCALRRI